MPTIDLVCLANSRKYNGRCVAGLRADGGGWVRIVGAGPEGGLQLPAYTVAGNGPARVLDLLRVALSEPAPQCHQPENWRMASVSFTLLSRPAPPGLVSVLRSRLERGPAILGDTSPRTEWEHYTRWGAKSSLALVAPSDLSWRIRQTEEGKRQARACFSLRGAPYDLPVTDPMWEQRVAPLGEGDHRREAAGIGAGERVLLTVSLGEPYNDFCYKLVAAVIPVPAEWRQRA